MSCLWKVMKWTLTVYHRGETSSLSITGLAGNIGFKCKTITEAWNSRVSFLMCKCGGLSGHFFKTQRTAGDSAFCFRFVQLKSRTSAVVCFIDCSRTSFYPVGLLAQCQRAVTLWLSSLLWHSTVLSFMVKWGLSPHYSMKHLAEKRFQDLNLDFGSCSLEVRTWCPIMEMKEDFNSSNQMKPNREIIPPHHLANMVGDCYVWACM